MAKYLVFQIRADFVSMWLMVSYVYGDVAEIASEMNVSLNAIFGEARQGCYGVE